jgi:hypothetical protein
MPPMVLYRTRGWTDIMRGSRVAMLAVLMSDLGRGGYRSSQRGSRAQKAVVFEIWVTKSRWAGS